MMPDPITISLLTARTVRALLAAVYLWSTNPARRNRAWRLLNLFLGR